MDTAEAYEAHHAEVARSIGCKVGDKRLAEDLAGAVWEKAVRHGDRVYAWLPWLRQVSRTVIADHYRCRRDVVSIDERTPAPLDTEREALARLDVQAVKEALPSLTPLEVQAVGLRAITGLSEKRIAALAGLSLAAVHMAACRGRRKLRARLEGGAR